jgi:hypothetical protein
MMFNTSLRLVGACVLAVGLGTALGGTAASAETSASAACVEPDLSSFKVERLDPTTYQVSLRDPSTVTCTDVTFNVSSYTIPETWDRNGWNPSALPQTEFDYAALTFPAGGTAPVSATVTVPACGPFQTDIYTGQRLTHLEWPAPMGEARITGTMRDQAACSQPSPSATTPAPETSTPASETSTPASETSTAPVVAPTASGTSSQAPASVLPTQATPKASAPEGDTQVLGTSAGTLPKTGGGVSISLQLFLAAGLIALGGTLLAALHQPAPVARPRYRRH